MPLIQSKSKKAFSKNVAKEMDSGKSQPQSLAIAYSVKRKPKKMANGGEVSASNEKRPMPDERNHDASSVSQNSGDKPSKNDNWTDIPTRRQAAKGSHPGKPNISPMSSPRMAPSSVFKARLLDKHGQLIDEGDLEKTAPPDGYSKQPGKKMDEESPDRQGPSTPSLKMKKMANGGTVDADHSGDTPNKAIDHERGDGAEEDNEENPPGQTMDDDQEGPSEEEYDSHQMAPMLAEGGEVDDSDLQPMPEEEIEHHASIAAAIMAKMKSKQNAENEALHESMMAEGGEVDINENNIEQPNDYYHQNEDEALSWDPDDSQMSDQPWDSNQTGDSREDDEENEHDSSIVSKIMKKRKSA